MASREEDDLVMTRFLASILGPDYGSLSSEAKRIEQKRFAFFAVFSVIFVIICVLVYVLSFRSGVTLKITQEQARVFGGIVAGIIPIFVVALFVDSSPRWSLHSYSGNKVQLENDARVNSKVEDKSSVTPLQLLFCLFGEIFALSSVLSPTTTQVRLATFAIAFLLFLFGIRLNEGVFALLQPGTSRVSSYIGVLSFLLFMLIFFGYFARISRITVIG